MRHSARRRRPSGKKKEAEKKERRQVKKELRRQEDEKRRLEAEKKDRLLNSLIVKFKDKDLGGDSAVPSVDMTNASCEVNISGMSTSASPSVVGMAALTSRFIPAVVPAIASVSPILEPTQEYLVLTQFPLVDVAKPMDTAVDGDNDPYSLD